MNWALFLAGMRTRRGRGGGCYIDVPPWLNTPDSPGPEPLNLPGFPWQSEPALHCRSLWLHKAEVFCLVTLIRDISRGWFTRGPSAPQLSKKQQIRKGLIFSESGFFIFFCGFLCAGVPLIYFTVSAMPRGSRRTSEDGEGFTLSRQQQGVRTRDLDCSIISEKS